MEALKMLYHSLFGPRLMQIFVTGSQAHLYQANAVERMSDGAIRCAMVAYGVVFYCWPIILPYLYRKGTFEPANAGSVFRVVRIAGGVMLAAYTLRGVGRLVNTEYRQMLRALVRVQEDPTNVEKQRELLRFDITLHSAPPHFRAKAVSTSPPPANSFIGNCLSSILHPYSTLTSVLTSALGRPMIYPGSTGLINFQLGEMLMQQRRELILNEGGVRRTLGSVDGNKIDSMFFDRREAGDAEGRTLLIVSDGNAAFYEIGSATTCLKTPYSVLGWNHPGFGSSTGLPFPAQEKNAIEAVYQYATEDLGFTPDEIMLYSWSIGAYCNSFLAQSHPDIAGVILDATFDDITPLAVNRMPAAISWFVEDLVHQNMHLNPAEMINKYDGPLTVIRRSRDEMMMTDGTIPSNRGNYLFRAVFQRRFPNLVCQETEDLLADIFRRPRPDESVPCTDPDLQESLLSSYTQIHGHNYPCMIGADMEDADKKHLATFIIGKTFHHFTSQHCVQLPPPLIRAPWELP